MPLTYQPKPQSPGFLTQALMRIGQMLGMDPHPQDQPYGLMARSLLEAQPSGKPASIGPLPEDKAYSDWLGAVHRANPDFGLDPQGLAFQMFAGPLAKTANKEMLKKAQNMLDEGVDRAKIWADTGWFKDVDDKWKFEIDDSAAKYSAIDEHSKQLDYHNRLWSEYEEAGILRSIMDKEGVDIDKAVGIFADRFNRLPIVENPSMVASKPVSFWAKKVKEYEQSIPKKVPFESQVGKVIRHGPLESAYPGIGGMNWGVADEFNMGMAYGSYDIGNKGAPERIMQGRQAYGPEGKSDILHELQHAVQGREGFASGGNPEAIAMDPSQYLPEVKTAKEALYSAAESRGGRLAEDMDKWLRGEGVPSTTVDRIQKELKKMPEYAAYKAAMESADPYGVYKRLAGEAEARNVQTRMNFSPEERMARPPWTTLDVPEDQLLVRGLLGEDVGPQMATVYHGSPHKFDAFDMSKIGTGEGAQAYGHGLYFADNPAVAGWYSNKLSDPSGAVPGLQDIKWSGGDIPKEYRKVVGYLNDPLVMETAKTKQGLADLLESVPEYKEGARWLRDNADEITLKNFGNLYEVDLPDEAIGKMLDWDKPLSEQPESVLKNLEGKIPDYKVDRFGWINSAGRKVEGSGQSELTGRDIYNLIRMQSKEDDFRKSLAAGTVELKKRGIPGIKYLDQGSRGSGKGTYNYVVFDDQLPTILKRNNESLAERLMR